MCAFAPQAANTQAVFRGLVASPLAAPGHSLFMPNFSLLSILAFGIITTRVSGLSKDSVYGGCIYAVLDPGPGQLYYLRYGFEDITIANQPKIGYLLEPVSKTHARIFANPPLPE